MSYSEAVAFARQARKAYARENISLLVIAGLGLFLEALFCLIHWVVPNAVVFALTGLGLVLLVAIHIEGRWRYLNQVEFARLARRAAIQSEIHHSTSSEWNRMKSGDQ